MDCVACPFTCMWEPHPIPLLCGGLQIVRNGSHSIHAVSEAGVSVDSADGAERLTLRSLDAPLVALGRPAPFPNPCIGPDMHEGVSHNLANNVWGAWCPLCMAVPLGCPGGPYHPALLRPGARVWG